MDCYSLEDQNAEDLKIKDFDMEKELQDLVDRHRNILPVDIPDRNVAVKEFLAIDNLILDSNADIYILEDKLARNTTKRKVLSQAFDYATEVQKIPVEEFLGEIKERNGNDFLSEWFEESGDGDYFKEKLQYNLRNGFVTIVVVMDKISEKLREKVRLINRSSDYSILLVEVTKVDHKDEELVFVNSYGGELEEFYTLPKKESISFDEFVRKKAKQGLREEAVSYVSNLKTMAPKLGVEIERTQKSIGIKDTLLRWSSHRPPLSIWTFQEDYEKARNALENAPASWPDRTDFKGEIKEGQTYGKLAEIELKGAEESEIRELIKFSVEKLSMERP